MGQVMRATVTEDYASVERSGLWPNPSPPACQGDAVASPGHRRTLTRNQISYHLLMGIFKPAKMANADNDLSQSETIGREDIAG